MGHFFQSWSEKGQLADLFDAVNALSSGVAFAGLLIAIVLQKEDVAGVL